MGKENKYWEELATRVFDTPYGNDKESSNNHKQKFGTDYSWAVVLKKQLKKVFAWDAFDKKEAKLRLKYRLQKQNHPIIKLNSNIWKRVAVLLIAAIAGALLYSLLPRGFDEKGYTEVVVPMGQMSQVNLPDGSKIWLNSGTYFHTR